MSKYYIYNAKIKHKELSTVSSQYNVDKIIISELEIGLKRVHFTATMMAAPSCL